MLISCGVCNTKNKVIEVQDLYEIKGFTDRYLIIGLCSKCNRDIALLIETRIEDHKTFVNKTTGYEAIKTIRREQKRVKHKQSFNSKNNLQGWKYGLNKQRVNKYGKITSIKQYSCEYKTNKTNLEKTIYNK